ncbi:MAG: tRNA glutamyl-Q(34) synthetase GluQRS [Gallionellales bacterium RIFCSPHIGHO2_02_FULL_57_16]|nr:MAG: tRNA glutamyl-Q(34) synthetase GluQRS [Gallionellales bacterium RIFCSPHIGHO2_02_FULL_57_16]
MASSNYYRGRFAPSPTGPLHFGSLAAAVGSYLDAKYHHGIWLVRMEDLDTPRCVPGAADDILRTLEAFGLYWDSDVGRALPAVEKIMPGKARPTVTHQSQRTSAYEEALRSLQSIGVVYPCACTRKEIADSAQHGIDGQIYPGTCRNGVPAGREGRAWRVRTDHSFLPPCRGKARMGVEQSGRGVSTPSPTLPLQWGGNIRFDDALQGHITQHLESEIGDFVVKRADGLFAYQLAVVVDDAFQNITHVVRGADLLHSTPRQIYLQRLLGFATPVYMHLPIAVNAQGEKLSKQTLAPAVAADDVVVTLIAVLEFLRQQPPVELRQGRVEEVLGWAVANWQPERMKGCRQLPTPTGVACAVRTT